MAYLGTTQETIPLWSQRWVDGPFRSGRMVDYRAGTTQRELHGYACDHCGKQHHVIGKAVEPFYCHCQRLISVT